MKNDLKSEMSMRCEVYDYQQWIFTRYLNAL